MCVQLCMRLQHAHIYKYIHIYIYIYVYIYKSIHIYIYIYVDITFTLLYNYVCVYSTRITVDTADIYLYICPLKEECCSVLQHTVTKLNMCVQLCMWIRCMEYNHKNVYINMYKYIHICICIYLTYMCTLI